MKYISSFADLIIGKRELTLPLQVFRFILAGASTALLDFLTLIVLVEFLHLNYLVSATIGFVAGSVANYFISVRFVFTGGKYPNKLAEFTIFLIITLAGLALNYFTMYFFTELFLFPYFISKCFSLFFVTAANFLMKKFLVFKG
jgi:putative flippase GtrA